MTTIQNPDSASKSCLSSLKSKFSFFLQKEIDKLAEAIKKNDLKKVVYFHKIIKFNFNKSNDNGDTPLLIAVRFNRVEVVKFIIKEIKYVMKEDKNYIGDSALMIAVLNNNLEMTRFLVEEAGVDVDCRDNQGYTPFIAACANDFVDLIVYLACIHKADTSIKGYNKQSAAHRAAYYGNIRALKLIIKYTKLSFADHDKHGNTPIHLAAQNTHIEAIRTMIKGV